MGANGRHIGPPGRRAGGFAAVARERPLAQRCRALLHLGATQGGTVRVDLDAPEHKLCSGALADRDREIHNLRNAYSAATIEATETKLERDRLSRALRSIRDMKCPHERGDGGSYCSCCSFSWGVADEALDACRTTSAQPPTEEV